MREEHQMKEFMESVKGHIRESYPFDLAALEEKTTKKLHRRARRPKWGKMAWPAAMAVSIAVLFCIGDPLHLRGGLVERSGSAQAPAAFEWVQPDMGFSQALRSGYPILPAVKMEQNGYVVEIKDAMVDPKRITYTMLVSGERMEEIAREQDEKKQADFLYGQLSTSLGGISKTGRVSPDWRLIDGSRYLILKAEFRLGSGMETAWQQPNPVLPVQLVKRSNQGTDVLAEIPLTLPEDLASARKSIQPAPKNEAELGGQDLLQGLEVNRIDLYPTMMSVQMQAQTKNGYVLRSLSNPRLVDQDGKEYTPSSLDPSLQRKGSDSAEYQLDLIPSLYFEAPPKKLALKFDGATVSAVKTGSFSLKREGTFPMEAPFGNKMGKILRVYYENQKLHVAMPGEALTEETELTVDGVVADSEVFENGAFIRTFPVPPKEVYLVDTKRNDEQEIRMDGLVPILGGN